MNGSSLQHLSVLLRRERDILGLLLGGAAGATSAVLWDELLRSVSSLELHRAITAREAAVELGLPGEPTLQDLVDTAPEGWSAILADHRGALLGLAGELEALAPAGVGRPDGGRRAGGPARRRAVQRSLLDFLA